MDDRANVRGLIRMTRLCLPASATADTSSTWIRSPASRRTRTPPSTAVRRRCRSFSAALLDLLGQPIRITDLAPASPAAPARSSGSRATRRRRKRSTRSRALTADDIADCVLFALTRPLHVNVDGIVVKALAQTSGGRILRDQ